MRRADLAERIDTVEHRMDSMKQRLDASFNALMTQLRQSRREDGLALLAWRSDFSAIRAEFAGEFSAMRVEFPEGFSAMRARTDKLETAIADSRDDMKAQTIDLCAEMRAQTVDLLGVIRESDEDNCLFMLILHEEIISELELLAERRRSSS